MGTKRLSVSAELINAAVGGYDSLASAVQALSSGSPAGIYANLAALTAAKPTGDTKIYVTTDNGNWNYWTGTIWASGGVYQATSIADGSVGIAHMQTALRVNESINLFNKATVSTGKDLDTTNGNLINNAAKCVSDFIPVLPLMAYTRTTSNRRAYYTSEYVFISGTTIGTDFSTPENAAYMKISMDNTALETEMLSYTWMNTATYQEYVDWRIDGDNLSKLYPAAEEVSSRNLLVYETLECGVDYAPSTGVRTFANGPMWTAPIPVKPGHFYSFSTARTHIFWDATDVFIMGQTNSYVKAPVNAAYMRAKIISKTELIAGVNIVEGNDRSAVYILPKKIRYKTENIDGFYSSKWRGKSWWVMGDSQSTGDGIAGTYATQPYHYLLAYERGIIVNSLATSGRTISGTNENDMCMQVTNGKMPATEYAPDLITICGGANDYGYNYVIGVNTDTTPGTFKGGLNKLFTDLLTRFPKSSIGFITPLMRATNTANAAGLYQVDYINAIKEIAALYSIPVLDLYNQGGINFRIAAVNTALSVGGDGLHANNDGHKILAGRIGAFIESL